MTSKPMFFLLCARPGTRSSHANNVCHWRTDYSGQMPEGLRALRAQSERGIRMLALHSYRLGAATQPVPADQRESGQAQQQTTARFGHDHRWQVARVVELADFGILV